MPFFTLTVADCRYAGRVAETVGTEERGGRVAVRVVGLDDVCIRVKCESLEALRDEDVDECPICTDPLCPFDAALMCGHRFHDRCLADVRRRNKVVSCPMCREYAGQGGGFENDWSKRPLLEVLASCLAVVYIERTKAKRKQQCSVVSAQTWAAKRVKLVASDEDMRKNVLRPLMVIQEEDAAKLRAAGGRPVSARFPAVFARLIALALPSEEWAPELRRFVETMAPGGMIWERCEQHLTDALRTEI